MGFVRERHRIGAAAAGRAAFAAVAAAVLPKNLQSLGREHGRRMLAGELDALGKAGIRDRGRVDRPGGAVAEFDGRNRDVLRVDRPEGGGFGDGGDTGDRPRQALEQVEGVDGLGEQHAAAVARFGAAPGLRKILGRTPPADRGGRGYQSAHRAALDERPQFARGGAEAMLQHDRENELRPAHRRDGPLGPLDRDLDGLLQKHVLAGRRAALDEVEVGGRRGQHDHRVDALVAKHLVEIGGQRQVRIDLAEFRAPRRARRMARGDLDDVAELAQALQVRLVRHAEPDDGHAQRIAHVCRRGAREGCWTGL